MTRACLLLALSVTGCSDLQSVDEGNIQRTEPVAPDATHLEPVTPGLFAADFELKHQQEVSNALFPEGSGFPTVRIVVLPAFEPEWAVDVFGPPFKEARVRLVTARGQLYRDASVGVDVIEMGIEESVAATTELVVSDALQGVRYPSRDRRVIVNDGTSYLFWADQMSGMTTPLKRNTYTGKLADLASSLADYARSPEASREQSLERVNQLLGELRGAESN